MLNPPTHNILVLVLYFGHVFLIMFVSLPSVALINDMLAFKKKLKKESTFSKLMS